MRALVGGFGDERGWDAVARIRRAGDADLATLCDLDSPEQVHACGHDDCLYFDEGTGRCGLVMWEVPAKLGHEALEWFVARRFGAAEPPDEAEALLVRSAAP